MAGSLAKSIVAKAKYKLGYAVIRCKNKEDKIMEQMQWREWLVFIWDWLVVIGEVVWALFLTFGVIMNVIDDMCHM